LLAPATSATLPSKLWIIGDQPRADRSVP